MSRKKLNNYALSVNKSFVELETSLSKKIKNIACNINGDYKINCLKVYSNKEVYIPFSFIRKYFEINGKLVDTKNQEEYFEWSHSYSRIFYPDQQYDSKGKFLWFEMYNVELRDRVKCVSAKENVPLSSQWYPKGHFYPTQIAQYGLSHFSKNISESSPKTITLYENNFNYTMFLKIPIPYINYKTDHLELQNEIIYLNCQHSHLIFEIDFKVKSVSSLTFYLKIDDNEEVSVTYGTFDEDNTNFSNKTVNYGIGSKIINQDWFKLTRDLLVDLIKINSISSRKRSIFCVDRIEFIGHFSIRKFLLKTSDHSQFSISAGDWLVSNQNKFGGWDIKVKRKLSGGELILTEGWHSAMAQGHAISLLTRLYHVTGDIRYLNASKRAIALFDTESFQRGVKAMFFDKFVWYEEYPTVPSIFVLNGFIYSLFGLYDLSQVCDDHLCQKSGYLFEEGIRSLEAMLPLFDSGSGSFYDLRHLKIDVAPNIARWDYHSTHINQLLYLYTIVRKDIFHSIAKRWIDYMRGFRAPHN